MNSYRKVKSVAKDVKVHGTDLDSVVLKTMKTISDIVGTTLGPAGRPVLIERQEYGLPNMFTKDGVTVFRNLGFDDPTAHSIMEAARDAAVRTASEAGDGTTTATVLAEAIVRYTSEYCKKNPKVSPQKVVRTLEKLFTERIEPLIKQLSVIPDERMLKAVAKVSANGDEELASAVMECFDAIGDDGNIIITEQNGPSKYEVELLKGYPISIGYEDSCGKFFPLFLNDKTNNRVFLDKPVFLLYFGAITQIQTIEKFMQQVAGAWQDPENYGLDKPFNYNVVIVATGFSEDVLGNLSVNFNHPHTINVLPLLVPKTPVQNGELHLLMDLAAVTGAKIFDPLSNPIENAQLPDLGCNIQSFESTRYRSTVLGISDESLIEMRAEELKRSLLSTESRLDMMIVEERLAKLTGGIAKLKVIGSSSGELREKRDRAEDATFAVRGARKHGCLPGGGWTLKTVSQMLQVIPSPLPTSQQLDPIISEVLIPALLEPINRIFSNCGMNKDESSKAFDSIRTTLENKHMAWDAWNDCEVDTMTSGLLDSVPAVREAIRNSISIASLLGTLGGSIVFKRDDLLEQQEAVSSSQFMKDSGA